VLAGVGMPQRRAAAAAAAAAAAVPQLPASRTRQYFIFDAVVIDASNLSPCD